MRYQCFYSAVMANSKLDNCDRVVLITRLLYFTSLHVVLRDNLVCSLITKREISIKRDFPKIAKNTTQQEDQSFIIQKSIIY